MWLRSTFTSRIYTPAKKTLPWSGCRSRSRCGTLTCPVPSAIHLQMTTLVTLRDSGRFCGARGFPTELRLRGQSVRYCRSRPSSDIQSAQLNVEDLPWANSNRSMNACENKPAAKTHTDAED